ncbi:MAG: nucleotide pyrophosphohydrolase [Spirochaetales bacterium]|nr:MAG: nucleotide pyrophosphohydrolase [Spirochaetales bacterium]
MKEIFHELIELSRTATRCAPWVRQAGMTGYCRELKGEVDEVLQAIENDDIENLKEELGDLFLDLGRLCALAEEMGHFDMDDILAGVVEKVKRRQPFLVENRSVTIEEALEYWNSAKALEKSRSAGTDGSAGTE